MLRRRWTAQRPRSASGHSSVIARTRPGAPSETTRSGLRRPRRLRPRPRSSQSSVRSRWPRQTSSRTRAPSVVKPQATRTPSYLPVRPDGQVDRVEHEDQQADLAEAPGPEGPVAVAQLAAHGAHRRPADRTQASLSGEALDVTVTQAPDVGADDERLQRPGPGHP